MYSNADNTLASADINKMPRLHSRSCAYKIILIFLTIKNAPYRRNGRSDFHRGRPDEATKGCLYNCHVWLLVIGHKINGNRSLVYQHLYLIGPHSMPWRGVSPIQGVKNTDYRQRPV